jgi:hypothetical protein
MKEFQNLRAFSEHLAMAVKKQLFYEEFILRTMGQVIEDDAKRKFGIYQERAGPFREWAPLAVATMKDRERKGFEPNNPLYRTGDLMHSIHQRVNMAEKKNVIGSDSDIMVWQERGTKRTGWGGPIPPRPVLGPAAFQNKKVIAKVAAAGLVSWILGKPVKKTGL